MVGDQTLFIRGDEAEAAWAVIDPIEQAWAQSKTPPQEYAPGSWGPKPAMDLIEMDGRRWLHSGRTGRSDHRLRALIATDEIHDRRGEFDDVGGLGDVNLVTGQQRPSPIVRPRQRRHSRSPARCRLARPGARESATAAYTHPHPACRCR